MATKSVNSKVGGVMLAICLVILVGVVYFERENLAPYFGMGDGNLLAEANSVSGSSHTQGPELLSQNRRNYSVHTESSYNYGDGTISHTSDWLYKQAKNNNQFKLIYSRLDTSPIKFSEAENRYINCEISYDKSGKDTSKWHSLSITIASKERGTAYDASGQEAQELCGKMDSPLKMEDIVMKSADKVFQYITVPSNTLHYNSVIVNEPSSKYASKVSLRVNDETWYDLKESDNRAIDYQKYTLTFRVVAGYLGIAWEDLSHTSDIDCRDVKINGLPGSANKIVRKDSPGNCTLIYSYNKNKGSFKPLNNYLLNVSISTPADNPARGYYVGIQSAASDFSYSSKIK